MSMRRAPARVLAMCLSLSVLSPVDAGVARAQASDDPGVCVDGWRDVTTIAGLVPEDIAIVDPDSAWAVGGGAAGFGRRDAVVLRYRDASWSRVDAPSAGKDSAYMGAAVGRKGVAWAVGFARTPESLAPLAARLKDGAWRKVRTGSPGRGGATFTDVAVGGARAVWVSGFQLARPGRYSPRVSRWNGRRWLRRDPPLERGERGMLSTIAASSATGVWVGGYVARPNGIVRPYLARRAGGLWQRQVLPDVGDASIADIAIPGRQEGWAVGQRHRDGRVTPLVLRWDGVSWQEASEPGLDVGTDALLNGVWASGSGALSVVGALSDPTTQLIRSLTAHLMDGAWKVHLGDPGLGRTFLVAVAGDPLAEGWMAGRADPLGTETGMLMRACQDSGTARLTRLEAGGRLARARTEQAVPASRAGPARRRYTTVARSGLRIVDRAAAVGMPTESPTYGAVVADFDADGRADILLGRHYARAILFLERDGRYIDSGVRFGGGDRHGCAAADMDGSGLPDLYCTFGGKRGSGVKANQLWLDPGGPQPRVEPSVGGALEPLGRGRLALFIDADDDGQHDLFVGQTSTRIDGQPSLDRLYRRTGPAEFALMRRSGIDPTAGAWTANAADVDGDGREDLLLVHFDAQAAAPRRGVHLYRNTGNGFLRVTRRYRIRSLGEIDAGLVRLDTDRRPDLVQVSGDRIRISLQRGGRFVTVYERSIAGLVAMAAGDVDADGDQDLYLLRQKGGAVRNDIVLLNRGDGRRYRAVAVPAGPYGRADTVVPIDHDGNGTTDFLVLEGAGESRGPVRLIAFYR